MALVARLVFIPILILMISLFGSEWLYAQGYSMGPVQVTGSAGFSSELYGVSGIDSRRPAASGRLFANLTAEGPGFRYGLDMNLSTEQSSFRQNLNQVGLNASYRWLSVSAGDIRPVFSKFSLNGQNVRGGYVEATPGNFVIGAAGGRSQRAVKPSEKRPRAIPVFDRWMYAAKAGYQASGSDYFHVIGTYGQDASSSLSPGLRSEFELMPAENTTLSTEFGKRFLGNRLNLDGTATWASHNGNTQLGARGQNSTGGRVLSFSGDGTGSFSDYAGRVNLRFSESNYSLGTSYERVQPGFISMGLPYLRNDQEQFRFNPQVQLADRRVRLGLEYSRARNNLSGQLLNTNVRHHIGVNTQTRMSERLSVGGAYRLMLNNVVPERSSSSNDTHQSTHTVTLTPVYKWNQNGASHNIQLSSNLQLFSMERTVNGEGFENDFTNLTNSLNYSLTLDSGMSMSPGITHVVSRSAQNDLDALRSRLSISKDFFDRLITMSTSASYTSNTTSFGGTVDRPDMKSDQLSLNITAGYRLPIGDYLRLHIRGLRNSSDTGPDFSEVQARLQLNHRF